jgi:Flp pilus assembly protein TadG
VASRTSRPDRRSQRGSAIVDFALVSMVILPLFFGVLQVALIWHVRTTLVSAASDGARYAAAYDRTAAVGARRTSRTIDEVFGGHVAERVSASDVVVDGQPEVQVDVHARVPVIAFWGPTIALEVTGHAVKESLP